MFVCARSGQFIGFTLISALSGTPLTGASGFLSGYKSVDGSAQAGLSGNIVEKAFGQYVANLYDWDVSGKCVSYYFCGYSGAIPVEKTAITTLNVSGQVYPASGVNATVPIASVSGLNAVVPIASVSGINAVVPIASVSGLNAVVPIASISGTNAVVPAATLSGGIFLASGSIFLSTFASGVVGGGSGNLPSAWGGSGAVAVGNVAQVSGSVYPASGVNAVVPVATLSGVFVTVPIATISGTNVVATAAVASGSLYLASGSIFNFTFASGVIGGGSGNLPSAWGGSGAVAVGSISQVSGSVYPASGVNAVIPPATLSGVIANSGLFVTVPPATLSGVIANSGIFASVPIATISGTNVVATASVASGSLYLASGSIFLNTFASGVVGGGSGNLPSSWGGSGAVTVGQNLDKSGYTSVLLSGLSYLASGQSVIIYSGQISGQNVVAQAVLDKSGYSLRPTGLDAVIVESGFSTSGLNFRQAQSIIVAAAAGTTSGAGTAAFDIDAAGAAGTLRIAAVTSQSGNRTSVTLTPP